MAWKNIFTKTIDGVIITVCKAFIDHKAEYTCRFEIEKKGESGRYLSPNFPFKGLNPSAFAALILEADGAILLDETRDARAWADRVKALSAKPESNIKASGPSMPRDKNGPRATGKTAKKKAKLEAARKQASA
jgi:hypothetical protein